MFRMLILIIIQFYFDVPRQNLYFFGNISMGQKDLWDVSASENKDFVLFATHSYTNATSNLNQLITRPICHIQMSTITLFTMKIMITLLK